MRVSHLLTGVGLAALACSFGCRGNRSEKPPIHLQQNMDHQQRYDAQEQSEYFRDGRAMRKPPPGTVAVGQLKEDDHFYRGRGLNGRLIDQLPAQLELDEALLDRGQERYGIFCAPCHGETGEGDGIATRRGGGFQVAPKNFHEERLRAMPLGYFYKVISDGQGTMLPYAAQIPVADRWAISAWVRVLQISQAASADDVPPEVQNQVGGAQNDPDQQAGGAQ